MKKLAGLVVILATLILGSYYGMGIITERTLKKNLAMIDHSNGVFVEVEQYNRSLYGSTALLNWRMHVPAQSYKNQDGVLVTVPAQDYKMQVPLDIYHGPMMFVDAKPMFGLGYARSHVILTQLYAEQFSKKYTPASVAPVLNLSMFVNYLNDSSLEIGMPTFKLISKEGSKQFEWLGMTSDTSISSNNDRVNGHVTLDGISFQKDKVNAVLGKVVSDFDLHRTNLDLYMGDANVLLPSFTIMQDDKKMLDLQQLDVHSSSDIQEGLFSSHVKITLGKLLSAGKVYGPALLDVSLSNLDAQVLAKMNEQANELQQGSDADRQKALLMLMPELPKLLNKGARIEVSELSVTMPEGLIKGHLMVSLPAEGVDNPFQLIQKIQGEGKLVFAEAVMKQMMNDSVKMAMQKQVALQAAPVTEPASGSTPTPAVDVATPAPDSTPAPTPAPETAVPVTGGTPTPTPAAPASDTAVPATDTTSTSAPVSASTPVPVATSAEVVPAPKMDDQEAITKQANEKLANMVQSGLLSLQGSDYVVEFKLADGKLAVNGKPFNSAMMKF